MKVQLAWGVAAVVGPGWLGIRQGLVVEHLFLVLVGLLHPLLALSLL